MAALLASDALRDSAGLALDPATSRGNVAAQVAISCRSGATLRTTRRHMSITADLTNFAADNVMMGQKVEASALRVTASNDGYEVTGDVKINGTPATIDLTKRRAPPTPNCGCRR